MTPAITYAAETGHEGWNWLGVEAQLIISNYALWLVTLIGIVIEIYKLVKIERELKIITRMITALKRPLRLRRLGARRTERKISKQAARVGALPAPDKLVKRQAQLDLEGALSRANNGHF